MEALESSIDNRTAYAFVHIERLGGWLEYFVKLKCLFFARVEQFDLPRVGEWVEQVSE